ncbi:unnamed protein product [Prorocentrum cordatum]|uniref:WGR domain-containing protein n=1 Tax=Prorocentrum cordatum TaxID=2364126 RepID=A0ABN9W799_9DINO|nr:unnamed protein product [Polarella glacialis]
MADRDLAGYDAELASRARVIPGLDARLARIDARAGTDSFHVLQGLKDPEAEREVSKCCYLYQRFGSTGTRGAIEVEGPMEQPKVARLFAEVFKTKTGSEFGSVQPGDRANPGMYWLQQQATPDLKAQWQYYVSDGVDGKRTGWYPYEGSASDEVEELYSQHVANARESRTATRVVSSGYFTYHVEPHRSAGGTRPDWRAPLWRPYAQTCSRRERARRQGSDRFRPPGALGPSKVSRDAKLALGIL